ncbi:hypothetical protein D9758_009835 [Tetrapyrgos nigripes]|uniref:Cytochrome P450 n=1 Tax=Tetrapyrgos nigripes TaxID=182062 RepID=A0A8H5LSF5_9AGAR|nr:hypothetical protein D9758_009835 [Tetrapyrgos nigripes]
MFLLLLLFVVAAVVLYHRTRRTPTLPLPPGPKPLPLIGNVLDLSPTELWLRATQWSKHYGEVVYLHIFSQPLIFINSPSALLSLMGNAAYADKPYLTMVCDLCGCENMVAFTGYGPQSKRQRKLMNMAFSTTRIPAYHPLIERETHMFLRRLVSIPRDTDGNQLELEQAQVNYIPLIRRYAGQLTLSVVYGYQAADHEDAFLKLAEECVDLLANKIASGGGIWPVDIIPALRYLPEWMPGAGFLRKAREWKAKMKEFVDEPFEWVKDCMKHNMHQPSFCSTLLEDQEFNPAAASFSSSFASPSASPTSAYFKSFSTPKPASTPSSSSTSQFEFDLKWTANNLPHRLTQDDIYTPQPSPSNPSPKPVVLPKGSIVFGNIWAVMRNEELFERPDEFWPERYLLSEEEKEILSYNGGEDEDEDVKLKAAKENLLKQRKLRDPRTWVFGFGRRQCPGRNLVEDSIWLVLVCLMATMSITRPEKEGGEGEEGLKGFWPPSTSAAKDQKDATERPLPSYMLNGARVGAGEDLYEFEPSSFPSSSSKKSTSAQGKVRPLLTVEGVRFENSVFRTPTPFRVDIRPRNESALGLVCGEEYGGI